jgi:CRP-like cAMP-binding protein
MDYSLILSAQTLRLAPSLQRTPPVKGLLVVKNATAKTYLRVTPAQWTLLSLFEEPRMVPWVLDRAIRDRLCVPLPEFYELILKAVRAGILIAPENPPKQIDASEWRGSLSPQALAWPLGILFLGGMVLSLGFRPELPATIVDGAMGLLILIVAFSVGAYLTGCLIRGANGEVYHARWKWLSVPPAFRIDPGDATMLPAKVQDTVLVAEPAVIAAAAGLTTWHRPDWSFVPLLGLILTIRPFLGGRFASVVRLGQEEHQSDAHHAFIFPPNRGAKARWRALARGLGEKNTWVRVCYAIIWALMVVYIGARFTDTPPWSIEFWQANGARIAFATGGSLAALAAVYIVWEIFQFIRVHGRTWRLSLRQWYGRWFGGKHLGADEPGRVAAIGIAPLLRTLDATQRQTLAQMMEASRHGPWSSLPAFEGEAATHVALIASGRVGVRRQVSGRRKRLIQVLGPGDMIGLHDVADPNHGHYRLRTMTPVTLLTAERAAASNLILGRVTRAPFGNMVLKVPFLRGIPLCRNWHLQAVERFAHLSVLTEYPDGAMLFSEGQMVERFFIIFEGEATVSREKKQLATLRVGEFFGEIGLLQNSSANAAVVAKRNLRCLEIPRAEFLRFVTHNHAVALELERVSSERLGRPIFPVRQRDFVL